MILLVNNPLCTVNTDRPICSGSMSPVPVRSTHLLSAARTGNDGLPMRPALGLSSHRSPRAETDGDRSPLHRLVRGSGLVFICHDRGPREFTIPSVLLCRCSSLALRPWPKGGRGRGQPGASHKPQDLEGDGGGVVPLS